MVFFWFLFISCLWPSTFYRWLLVYRDLCPMLFCRNSSYDCTEWRVSLQLVLLTFQTFYSN